jgi:hypothetical protein
VKVYNKLVLDINTFGVLEEDSYEYSGPVDLAAGGYLTKQAILLTARFLNDVNDTVSGGAIFALPSGVQPPQWSQTIPGDRLVLDDASALALSDTAVGTLNGGIYMYVGTLASSAGSPQRACIAFFRGVDIGGSGSVYQVTSDVQPISSVPTYIAGVFINNITKGNFGWIQVAGAASVLFESALTATSLGVWVTAKIGPTTPGSADCGAAASTTTLAALLGVAIGTPVTSTVSTVMLTRGNFCGRI